MKSRSKLAMDSIVNSRDNLLIIVPPFINSLLPSIVLLNERFKSGLITHLTLLTLESVGELGDVIERYSSVLFIDPPLIMNFRSIEERLHGKSIIVVSNHDVDWVNAEVSIEYTDSLSQTMWQLLGNELGRDSRRFLEASIIYESTIIPNYDLSSFNAWSVTDPINYPALPGILRLPLSTALSRAFSPAIPGITGNESEAKNLVKAVTKKVDATYRDLGEEQVMDLFKYLSDLILRAGLRGDYLDKLMLGNRKWIDSNIDVLDSILAIEAQLVLWEYVNGIMAPILNPEGVKDVDGLATKYVVMLGNYVGKIDKAGSIDIDHGPSLTLIDRLCSIMNFRSERQGVNFVFRDSPYQVTCIFNEGEEVRDAQLMFKRPGYSIAIRGVFGED